MNKEFTNALLNIWEAPQNALGYKMSRLWKERLITIDNTTPEGKRELEFLYGLEDLVSVMLGYRVKIYISDYYSHKNDLILGKISGFSMGRYICLNSMHDLQMLKHEIGHCWHSQKWGWLFLPVVGIQSAVFCNLWDRLFHKDWCTYDRLYWYFIVKYYFEGQADEKGKAKRRTVLAKIPRPANAKYPPMENQKMAA